MLVKSIYDTGNPQSTHDIKGLLLKMVMGEEQYIEVELPNGMPVQGILREVTPLEGGRLVELYTEIDDAYETLFWQTHSPDDFGMVVRPNLYG